MKIRSFRKILVANRGEIALRVMRACRAMGIQTVAVYSDADADAPHARFADESVWLGAAPAAESYLRVEKILEAAARTGADAIHPGYGFLSENAEFAERCSAAGVIFIGPPPTAIRAMGLKSSGRKLAAEAGLPIVPGYDGDDQRDETLRAKMKEIGFPALIKASAGGGGKGMRVVRSEDEIEEALGSARREAEKAFGDGALLLEKYVEGARHVEIQILGDARGALVHLFERDCSCQRRHQKIIEESPSPAIDAELREKMGAAAVRLGRALGYVNAGTVEFIVPGSAASPGEFYFIEVNTRLQVEHPVTEMVTGLDMVKLQIEIAEGRPLPFTQADLKADGHAIEARLYAENPANDFLPSAGKIVDLRLPEPEHGLRVDAGIERGMEVGIHYDPMLAKLIAHAETREAAIRKLAYALRRTSVAGPKTNREFLIRLLDHPEFGQGRAGTEFIAGRLPELIADEDRRLDRDSLIAATLYLQLQWRASDGMPAELPPGYRNNPYRDPSIQFQIGADRVEASWRHTGVDAGRDIYEVTVFDSTATAQVLFWDPQGVRIVIDGMQRSFQVVESGGVIYVHSSLGARALERLPRHPIHRSAQELGSANSPMPGQVLKILIEVGQKVSAGDPLIVLEAMKMEHTMRAAVDGVVEEVLVRQGEVIAPGQLLARVTSSSDAE
jgi:acetyl-CoA carboxylase biotin carboxylase subunit